jgi:hypothetical protein
MKEAAADLNQRIAGRVHELRAAQGLSLDALYHDPTREPARHAVVIATEPPARR